MSNYTLRLISIEEANTAYADGIRKARRLRKRAGAVRKIAAALGGAYITKRLEQRLEKMFPGLRASLHKTSYNHRRYINIHDPARPDYREDMEIMLHEGEDRRINAAAMLKDAAGIEAEAAALEAKLARFTSTVCQYNALATAYAGMLDDLGGIVEGLPYSDWSLRH